jgi:hypothetical protein
MNQLPNSTELSIVLQVSGKPEIALDHALHAVLQQGSEKGVLRVQIRRFAQSPE